ncbi:MAG: hypothetical protein ABSD75_29355 [Terriglobales bacterium]|jgi:pimeloyl-ACP methyl ester carboxylesterase
MHTLESTERDDDTTDPSAFSVSFAPYAARYRTQCSPPVSKPTWVQQPKWGFSIRSRGMVIAVAVMVASFPLLALAQARREVAFPWPASFGQGLRVPPICGCDTSASAGEESALPPPLIDNSRPPAENPSGGDGATPKAIIIGFVGGFVKHDDAKHPEVQFAAYLRDRYRSSVFVEVFSNHNGEKALRQILCLLDTDHDGNLTATEKEQARIVIYGHSWGAAETVSLARKLGRNGIPVLLTIQVDTVAKPGQRGSPIPPNVASAVNFYQSRGPIHGRSEIVAADPARTKIIGNFRMSYQHHPINCDNYSWYARVFNKPHHEIENDPVVWNQAASLIDSKVSSLGSKDQTSSSSKSASFNVRFAPHR